MLDNPALSAKWLSAPLPEQHVFDVGETLAGRFEIVRFIGRGGMGEVYEANDLELGDHVAIKTVLPEFTADPTGLRRFKREIQLARKVTHPNVCRIFDVAHHERDGRKYTFLSMELLEGETLSEHLKTKGRLTTDEALPLVRQMAAGLDALHQAGIVHRDFKPGNVMLVSGNNGEARVVVTDFGLARQAIAGDDNRSAVTLVGEVLGTPEYMAPEQLAGEPVGCWTDVYSLGVIVYEAVTGQRPFRADTPLQHAFQKNHRPPTDPRIYVEELSGQWCETILQCLDRDPANRPPLLLVAKAFGTPDRDGRLRFLRRWIHFRRAASTSIGSAATSPWDFGRQIRSRRWLLGLPITVVTAAATITIREWWADESPPVTTKSAEALRSYSRAIERHAEGKLDDAVFWLRDATKRDPDFGMAHCQLASYLSGVGRYDRAFDSAKAAYRVRDLVSEPERYLISGNYHLLTLNLIEASKAFDDLTDLLQAQLNPEESGTPVAPMAANAHRQLATVYSYLSMTSDAINEAKSARALDPANVVNDGLLAILLCEGQEWDQALAIVGEAQRQHRGKPYPSLGAGLAWLGRGDYEKAREALGDLIKAGGVYRSWGHLLLAESYVLQGKLEAARMEIESSAGADEVHENQQNAGHRRYRLARLYALQGRRDQAAEQLRGLTAISDLPPNADHLRNAALVYIEIGRIAEAKQLLSRLEEIDREFPGGRTGALVRHVRGEFALERGDTGTAREALEAAREKLQDASVLWSLGRLYDELGRYRDAKRAFESILAKRGQILRIGLDFSALIPLAHLHLARCEKRSGNRTGAIRNYEQFLDLWGESSDEIGLVRDARREYRRIRPPESLGSARPRTNRMVVSRFARLFRVI